jgi:hypothetical protein
MSTIITAPLAWQRWNESGHLVLLAAFEDSVTCTRVKDFCQGLSRDLGGRCKIIQHVWVFSTFRMKELQEIAAEEASVADLIIISAHQAESLPEEVKRWVDGWLEQKGARKPVLLALLDSIYDGVPSPIRAYLQGVAQRGGMEFLVESGETS